MPAVHLATGRQVEIQRATGSTAELMRLKRALRDHADVMHPGWILPIDAGLDDKGLYVVYPDPGGESLDALMNRPLPVAEVVEFLRQMGQMLGELHVRGQYHGLLRPDCIRRVRAVDGTTHYRVVDVGLINSAFAVFDTEWAAPESKVDALSDIHVLGRLAVSMLGGRATAEQQMVPGDTPVGLTRMLMAMLSTERVQRPLSGTAVLQGLNTPVAAQSTPPPTRPQKEPPSAMTTIPGLSEMSSESTFDRNLEVMTNQWRPLRRIALVVLIGGAIMFYVMVGILQRPGKKSQQPAEVPHPSATTSRPDGGSSDSQTAILELDAGSPPAISDAAILPLDVPDLAIVFSPVLPIDASVPEPTPAAPAVEVASPPVPPKAKKRKRRRIKAKKPRTRRRAKRRGASKTVKPATPVKADPYLRL